MLCVIPGAILADLYDTYGSTLLEGKVRSFLSAKGNVNKNQFYFCLNCKYNLCPLCINVHNNRHNIINYDIKNYICLEHCESFSSYCKTCNKDICIQCEENHDEHEIVILTATSGDTGKAALEGYRDVEGVEIAVFYPVDA